MKDAIVHLIAEALRELGQDIPFEKIILGKPSHKQHGDYFTNVAMAASKNKSIKPADVASQIIVRIKQKMPKNFLKNIELAGPGFINFFVADNIIQEYLFEISRQGENYGRSNKFKNKTVLIEFVSANPTGPLHIGHGRWAVLGDVIANLLSEVGYKITREFYINDVGRQTDLLVESVLARKEGRDVPKDGYAGEYIADIAKQNLNSKSEILNFILNQQKKTLDSLVVKFDNWFSEKKLHSNGKITEVIKMLKEKGYTYEKDGALWFKSTDFGDDKDRVLLRETGENTYFASDIAYHENKFERNYDCLIDIWGTDHHGYVARVKAAIAALGYPPEKLEIIIGQLVTLYRGLEPVRMSKRTGEMITLSEVISEIGRDACRFFFLLNSADSHLDFDIELAKKQSSDNPVYYVQYAHARICSIFRENKIGSPDNKNIHLNLLTHESERDLMRKLIDYPDEVFDAAAFRSPHRLTAYAIEVSKLFHSFYHKCRVLSDDIDTSKARLYLLQCTRIVLSNVLKLLGISAPQRM